MLEPAVAATAPHKMPPSPERRSIVVIGLLPDSGVRMPADHGMHASKCFSGAARPLWLDAEMAVAYGSGSGSAIQFATHLQVPTPRWRLLVSRILHCARARSFALQR